jgi:lysozyme family protein
MCDNIRIQYDELYESMEFLPGKWDEAAQISERINANQYRYKAAVKGLTTPWFVVALIHQMEADGNFQRQLINGEPYNRVTRRWPKGKGPWVSWEASTLWNFQHSEDAEVFMKRGWDRWRIFDRLERYNGLGYRRKELPTPYLWAGSNHGANVGKFVEEEITDGVYKPVYRPELVSDQIGAALIYKVLMER